MKGARLRPATEKSAGNLPPKLVKGLKQAENSKKQGPKPKKTLKVRLGNRWTTFLCSPERQIRVKKFFRYHPKNFEQFASYKAKTWDGWANVHQRGKVPTGLFLQRRRTLEKEFLLEVIDEREVPEFGKSSVDVREYQERAVDAMVSASGTGGIIVGATGSGKTRIAAAYFSRLKGFGVFLVDELALLEQTRVALEGLLKEEIGVVANRKRNPKRITVAMVQTLQRHAKAKELQPWFAKIDALLLDEFHVHVNERAEKIVAAIRPKAVFGLTATLETNLPHVRFPATALAGPVIFNFTIAEGVKEKVLSEGVVVSVRFRDPLKGSSPAYFDRQKNAYVGGTSARYRRHVALNGARNKLVEDLAREGVRRGRFVAVLVENRVHLRALDKRFANLKHATLSGSVKVKERREAFAAMIREDLHLILATRVFSKGIDVPNLDAIVDATAFPGRNGVIQRYGRGTRVEKKKKGTIFFDVTDVDSPFEEAGEARIAALRETGAEIISIDWRTPVANMYRKALS